MDEEMTEHLGYPKHDSGGDGSRNVRNGTRAKTVLTEASGPVEIEGPRDRAWTFEPQIVRKRQRRLGGVGEEMADWQVRPLDQTYAAIFIDAIVVKVRDGHVANSAVLRGHRGHPGRRARHPGPVSRERGRGRGREVHR